MLIIEEKTIKISRGDSGTIKLTIPLTDSLNYSFKVGDKIQFRVFEKKGYNKDIIFEKEVEVIEEKEEISINLLEEDTIIGEDINKPVTYWYEIALNEIQTIVGYDDDGPAEFIVYPAKGGK